MLKIVFYNLIVLITLVSGKIINFEDEGAIRTSKSIDVAYKNRDILNSIFVSIQKGDTLIIPNQTYFVVGGIVATGLINITIQVDGTLLFSDDRATWPKSDTGSVLESMTFSNIESVIFTSSGLGTFDGNGKSWWGSANYLLYQENRPRLLRIVKSKDIIVENLLFKDAAFWTFWATDCNGLVIRYCTVDVRWSKQNYHTDLDLQAYNTDGFDVTGKYVHIHDCTIWNDDDCIAVKDSSEHMLFERITASGLGLVVGSIGRSKVNNITFRDSVMRYTVKGIYLKTRWYDDAALGPTASISNVLYQNITMYNPQQYPIWIGPAQQTGQPCSITWPQGPGSECRMSGTQTWTNITLKDIYIFDSKGSLGVLFGNTTNPITNLVFENVVGLNSGQEPWGEANYYCEGVQGIATGSTDPVPPCFERK